jgi:hypothetical protein
MVQTKPNATSLKVQLTITLRLRRTGHTSPPDSQHKEPAKKLWDKEIQRTAIIGQMLAKGNQQGLNNLSD